MRHTYRSLRRRLANLELSVLLPLFAALLLAGLWTAVVFQIQQERTFAFQQASSRSEALAATFEVRTARILHQIEQVTRFIKFEFERHGGERALPELIAGGVLPASIVNNRITMLNADGKAVASNHGAPDPELAQRSAFRTHLEQDDDSLHLGEPVFNRAAKQWLIHASRRLNHADGSFAGVIVVALPQAYLTDFYGRAGLGSRSSVSLLGTDGVFRAIRVGNRMLPNDPRPQPLPSAVSAPARHHGAVAGAGAAPVPRIVSYRQLKDFPLIVIVGMAEEDIYARASERRVKYLWSAGIASALILAAFALLMGLSRRLRRSMLLAREAQATFRAAAEGSLDAFYILKAERDISGAIRDFTFVTVNRRAAQLFGESPPRIVGQKLSELPPPGAAAGFLQQCKAVAGSGEPREEECSTADADGRARWWYHQWIPLDDGIAVTSRDISQRKQIETENRNNAHFLQSLIDYIPTLIYVKSLAAGERGQMLVWNKAAEDVTGYSAAQVVGRTLDQIFPPAIARQLQKFSDRMLADPRVIDVPEAPFRRRDGKQLYVRTTSVPLFDANGKPAYLLGMAVDVTERRARELELRTKQAELAAANDSSPLGLFRTDATGHCTYVNRAYEEMSGLRGAEALGAGWAHSIHPQDRLKVFQAWGRSARTHEPYQGVYRFVHSDGRVVWVSAKTAPILVDGRLLGHVGSVDDITARRAAEKALLESEQHLHRIADTLPALVAYVDAEQRFRFNNLAYQRVFGIDRDALRGKTVRELLGEALYLRVEPYVARVLGGATVTFEIDAHRHGEYRCFETTYTPQFDDEDGSRVVGFHVMSHDITAKKIHERRLVELTQIDSLTGLLNRAGFEKRLIDAMSRSRQSGMLMALIYMDIDHFKQINDTYGHPIGDALLKSFVARLSRALRSTDSVARLGGDEFTIVMERLTKPQDAVTVADKIGEAMRPPFLLESHAVRITVSIGLAYFQGGAQDPNALLKLADDMLYQAKKAGRNTYRIAPLASYEPSP